MSTFNGSSYIREQVSSIQKQTLDTWELLIRDDGSSDNTVEIIQEYIDTDKRISLVSEKQANLGAMKSFNALINIASERNADYLMFCDQDDFWEPWKIEKTLQLMLYTEKINPPGTPILAHTDLFVVDSDLKQISASYLRHQRMHNAENRDLQTLLSQNYVTGCTIMINKDLLTIAQPIPDVAIMHDWWYSLCASVTGKIAFLDTPTIKYRQHSTNVYGSSGFFNMLFSGKRLHTYLSRKRSNYLNSYSQDLALRERLAGTKYCNTRKFDILNKYCSIGKKPVILRLFIAIRLGIHQQGILRNFFFFYSLIFIEPDKMDSNLSD